jgi:hypothetical protein
MVLIATVTTWDASGRRTDQPLPDGPVRNHLLDLGEEALGCFPDLDQVVYRSTSTHTDITITRKATP